MVAALLCGIIAKHKLARATGDIVVYLRRNKRYYRVHELDERFERIPQQSRGILRIARFELYLGELDIPIAELVPDKIVQELCRMPYVVFVHGRSDRAYQCVELAQKPAVGRGQCDGTRGVAVLARAEHEPCGIVELVHKVAVRVKRVVGKTNVAAARYAVD